MTFMEFCRKVEELRPKLGRTYVGIFWVAVEFKGGGSTPDTLVWRATMDGGHDGLVRLDGGTPEECIAAVRARFKVNITEDVSDRMPAEEITHVG
jgi:hypothetical protein